jgi:hypothetical protein
MLVHLIDACRPFHEPRRYLEMARRPGWHRVELPLVKDLGEGRFEMDGSVPIHELTVLALERRRVARIRVEAQPEPPGSADRP